MTSHSCIARARLNWVLALSSTRGLSLGDSPRSRQMSLRRNESYDGRAGPRSKGRERGWRDSVSGAHPLRLGRRRGYCVDVLRQAPVETRPGTLLRGGAGGVGVLYSDTVSPAHFLHALHAVPPFPVDDKPLGRPGPSPLLTVHSTDPPGSLSSSGPWSRPPSPTNHLSLVRSTGECGK